jgi:hypothetical protein
MKGFLPPWNKPAAVKKVPGLISIIFVRAKGGACRNIEARSTSRLLRCVIDFLASTPSLLPIFPPILLLLRASISKLEMFVGLSVRACPSSGIVILLQLYCKYMNIV